MQTHNNSLHLTGNTLGLSAADELKRSVISPQSRKSPDIKGYWATIEEWVDMLLELMVSGDVSG